jgi:SAM-dependent methyltransferase
LATNVGRWTDDARLVLLYDIEYAGRRDHDFYLALAQEPGVRDVADLGCGTGVLAVELAAAGLNVTAVDPSGEMLGVARARAGTSPVTWIEGYADCLPDDSFDLVVMEGHVAQYFVSAMEWDGVLREARRALRPNGHLAFESRNPVAGAWRSWTESDTSATYPHPEGGTFTSWVESIALDTRDADGPIETHRGHTVLPDGTHLISDETLRFRPLPALASSLERAGFAIEQAWGDWDCSPVSERSPEFIVLSRKI